MKAQTQHIINDRSTRKSHKPFFSLRKSNHFFKKNLVNTTIQMSPNSRMDTQGLHEQIADQYSRETGRTVGPGTQYSSGYGKWFTGKSPNVRNKPNNPFFKKNITKQKAPTSFISKFSDTGHHEIEEYALPRAGLDAAGVRAINQANTSERMAMVRRRYGLTNEQIQAVQNASLTGALRLNSDQIEGVHRGNTERDYSQLPYRAMNLAMLGRFNDFGGYRPIEHFDNFIFDVQNQRWRSRGEGRRFKYQDLNQEDPTPIDYIASQLNRVAEIWPNESIDQEDKMVRVGNAFHTVEDFFAHSNFVELIQGDFRHGRNLVTGSVGSPIDPENNGLITPIYDSGADQTVSISHILAGISSPETSEFYEQQAHAAARRSAPLSHSRIAKDTPDAHNYPIARRLAALVIQQLTTDLLIAMLPPTERERKQLLDTTLMQKVRRYLRAPQNSDKWWETLQSNAPISIDRDLNRIHRRTPLTVNNMIFSPLRNIEASSKGPMRFPVGMAIPVSIGDTHIFIQAGALGVLTSTNPETGETEGGDFLWGGLQIGGSF